MPTPTTNQNPTPAMLSAGYRAVFELQYNSRKAARFIQEEVPNVKFEDAMATITKVVNSRQS